MKSHVMRIAAVAVSGVVQDSCASTAEAALAARIVESTAIRDAALVQAEHRE